MILETTMIIDLMDKLPSAIDKMEQLQRRREKIFISTVSIFELWTGIAQSQHPEKEYSKVIQILNSQQILDLTQTSAQEAGKINGNLWKNGAMIDPEDCMIAGIAKSLGETVLTRNLKHFGRIEGLSIETY